MSKKDRDWMNYPGPVFGSGLNSAAGNNINQNQAGQAQGAPWGSSLNAAGQTARGQQQLNADVQAMQEFMARANINGHGIVREYAPNPYMMGGPEEQVMHLGIFSVEQVENGYLVKFQRTPQEKQKIWVAKSVEELRDTIMIVLVEDKLDTKPGGA